MREIALAQRDFDHVIAHKAYEAYRLTCHLARLKREKFGLNVDDTAKLRP